MRAHFFRETLTVLAGIVVVLLTAALIGPRLVDWNARRDFVESVLTRTTGARVSIAGSIDVVLLPTPRLDVRDVTLGGERDGAPSAHVERVRLELAAAPLLRGAVRFVDARIERPRVVLTMQADGVIALPAAPPSRPPEEIAFENVVISDATLVVQTPQGAPLLTLRNLDVEAAGEALSGPLRAVGRYRAPVGMAEAGASFTLALGALEQGAMRLRFLQASAGAWPRIELDGRIAVDSDGSGARLAYSGAAVFIGADPVAWRLSGPLTVTAQGAQLDPAGLRVGERQADSDPPVASGAAQFDFASGKGSLALAAQRVDLDALLAAPRAHDAPIDVARWFDAALARVSDVSLKADAIALGGDAFEAVSLHVRSRDADAFAATLAAQAPARSRVSFDGAVMRERGAPSSARLVGRLDAGVGDTDALAGWLAPLAPKLAAIAQSSPFRRLDVAGDVVATPQGFDARNLSLTGDRSRFAGRATLAPAQAPDQGASSPGGGPLLRGSRARLTLDLTSPALDIDGAPDLTAVAGALDGVDLAIALDARATRLARFGQGVVEAGRIRLSFVREAGMARLESLSLDNVGGATLNASGAWSAREGRFDLDLNADRLADLSTLLRRVAPGGWSDALVQRAAVLAPLRLSVRAAAQGDGAGLRWRRAQFRGAARATLIEGEATPKDDAPGGVVARVTLSAPEAGAMLRQMGVDALAVNGFGPGRIEAQAQGDPAQGYAAKAVAQFAGVQLDFDGRLGALAPDLDARGRLRLTSADAAPLLTVLALPSPGAGVAALDLAGDLAWRGGRLSVTALQGAALGARVSGDLALGREREPASVLAASGALRLDRLSLASVAALALGAPSADAAAGVWSSAPFAQAPGAPIPVTLTLDVGALDLGGGLVGKDAHGRLKLAPGLVALDAWRARLGEGAARGAASLRRNGASVSLSGQIGYDGPLVGAPDVAGGIDATLDLAGVGDNSAALVASLGGAGRFEARGVAVARANPDAAGVAVAALAGDRFGAGALDVTPAATRNAVQGALAGGVLKLPDPARGDLALAGGVLRFALAAPPLEGRIDLRALTLEAAARLASPAPMRWSGPPPAATLRWSGPLRAIERGLDVDALVNGLSALALVRESERVAAVESDLRERAIFNRRARAAEFLERRARELAAFDAELARRAEQDRLARENAEKDRLEKERLEKERAERLRHERARAPVPVPAPAAPPTPAPGLKPEPSLPLDLRPPQLR